MKKNLLFYFSFLLPLSGVNVAGPQMVKAATPNVTYETYLNKNIVNPTSLTYGPTLILNPKTLNDFTNVDVHASFYDVILETDNNLNLTYEGTKYNLTEILDTYVKGKYVPVVRITDSNVERFLSWWNNEYRYYDMMVVSSSLDAIGKIYQDSNAYLLNSVYDLTSITLPSSRFANWQYVRDANKVGANTLLLNGDDPNISITAEYCQAMAKVAWAMTDSSLEDAKALTDGCYGIVSDHPAETISTLKIFDESGWASPQHLAAHRGITTYCNENSITACLAAYSEGASHIEVDLQVCKDEEILLCHNSQTNGTSTKSGWYFVNTTSTAMSGATLNDYNERYGETYPSLRQLIKEVMHTDLICLLELKFDGCSDKALNELHCIENFKRIIDETPDFYGHFFAITFYAPLAEKMKELMPEIPLGYIGGARSGYESLNNLPAWGNGGGHVAMTEYANKVKFLRHYNIGLDENHDQKTNAGDYYCDVTGEFYLARGFVQNTWTYENDVHFGMKSMIATTNAADLCHAYLKDIENHEITMSASAYESGKLVVKTTSYNGWQSEKECQIKEISREGSVAYATLYATQTGAKTSYGRYSKIVKINIQ